MSRRIPWFRSTRGRWAQRQEIPFSLRIPTDALPNWEDASTYDYGVLGWALVVESDIAAGLDEIITRSIPVDRSGRTWTGPARRGEPRVQVSVERRGRGC